MMIGVAAAVLIVGMIAVAAVAAAVSHDDAAGAHCLMNHFHRHLAFL